MTDQRPTRRDRPLNVVLAGGGTGGHLYPLVSVAEAVRKTDPDAVIRFFTSDRPLDTHVQRDCQARGTGFQFQPQSVTPLLPGVVAGLRFVRTLRQSVRQCRSAFRADRPHVVLGGGGYAGAPAIIAARRLGIYRALLNPDVKPGRANRFLADRVEDVFVQWPQAVSCFAHRNRLHVLGCPVREAFQSIYGAASSQAEARREFGLDPDRRTLLVTGASQGARGINNAMCEFAGSLAKSDGWQVLHLAGKDQADTVRRAYDRAGLRSAVLAYTDRMPVAMIAADLIVCRAGASTLAEVTAARLPAVLIPYPHHRDRHQYANADVLASAGAARIVEQSSDSSETAGRLAAVLDDLMRSDGALSEMSRAAAGLAKPDAAETIAFHLIAIARAGRRDGRTAGSPQDNKQAVPLRSDWGPLTSDA